MRLLKALNLLAGDVRPSWLLGSLHFVVAASHVLFDIGATSLLIAHLGAEALPQVYVGSAAVLILSSLLVIPLIDRLERSKLFGATLLVFASLLAASHAFGDRAPDVVYRGLYILCYLMKSLVFLQFWLIAGQVCDLRQAKRIFPILLGFSLAGGLTAAGAASWLPRWIGTEGLLLGAAVLLIAGLAPMRLVSRHYRSRLQHSALGRGPVLRQAWRQLRSDLRISLGSPFLRVLSYSFFLMAVLAQVLDFLMGKAASLRFVDSAGAVDLQALTSFYALLNGSVIGAGALVQFLVANRLISSLGVTRGHLAAPLTFLIGFGSVAVASVVSGPFLGSAFFFTVLISRVLQKVVRISIYRTSSDLIFQPIPAERRGRAKAFKETVIDPSGALFGGVFLLVTGSLELRYLVLASLSLSVAMLLLSLRIQPGYLESLVHVLREKSRFRFAFPSTVMRQVKPGLRRRGGVSDLRRALGDDEVSVRLLAAEVAAELREPAAAPLLVHRFREEPDPKVRATMVSALGKLLRRQDALHPLQESLQDWDPRVRAQSIEALAQMRAAEASAVSSLPAPGGPAEDTVHAAGAEPQSVDGGGKEETAAEVVEPGDQELAAKTEHASALQREAILDLARSGRREAIQRLIELMEEGDGAFRHLATRTLGGCGEVAVDFLVLALWSSDVDVRRYVVQALGSVGTPLARQALVPVLSLEAEEAYYDLLRLGKLKRLRQTSGVELLMDALQHRVQQGKRNALQVLHTVFGDREGMRLILSNLNHPEPDLRLSAIEALEVRLDVSLLGGILPLFEHVSPQVIAEHGGSLYRLPAKKPLQVLFELSSDRSRWVRACALYAIGQVGGKQSLPWLERRLRDPYELVRLNAIEALGCLPEAVGRSLLERIRREEKGRAGAYAEAALSRIRGPAALGEEHQAG